LREATVGAACLNTLKKTDRELLQAVYEHAKPVEEIAKSTGKAMQTLYNHLSILHRGLLDCIEKRLSTEEVTG
jgi:DNA-directed RNA polymerase specialized sigma24 family protein